MRMRAKGWVALLVGMSCGMARGADGIKSKGCVRAVFEGEVEAGKGFEKVFAPRFQFLLEPIASGWIVRVLAAGVPRGPHDYAEIATPPYQSVTPLAVSTDFSFRAQDAVGWNPRQFRYAGSAADFRKMVSLYAPAMDGGDALAAGELAAIAAEQPEAQLTILEAHLVPGANDQAQMAAAVASHFATTPHTVDQSGGQSPLGRVTWLKFRVSVDLLPGMRAAPGVTVADRNCAVRPTLSSASASQPLNPVLRK